MNNVPEIKLEISLLEIDTLFVTSSKNPAENTGKAVNNNKFNISLFLLINRLFDKINERNTAKPAILIVLSI